MLISSRSTRMTCSSASIATFKKGMKKMRLNNEGVLMEKPLGVCPECGDVVYASEEIDGVFEKKIAWVCASDLHP